jgi:hypothetical protein
MNNRDFKGVWIPKEIWLNSELSALDRVLLAEINSLDNENHCTASNDYFAEFCGVGVATITRSIKKLKTMGFIETEMVNCPTGSYRVIKMIMRSNQNDETGVIKMISNYNSDNNTDNKMVLSKDNTIETTPVDFQFGKQKSEKPNLYTKCISIIDEYTNNLKIRTLLIQYLDLCLEMKSIRGANQWKGMINTLNTIYSNNPSVTLDKIISQSIERGWKTFYPVNTSTTNNTNFSETTEMQSKQYKSKVEDRARDKNGNLITY